MFKFSDVLTFSLLALVVGHASVSANASRSQVPLISGLREDLGSYAGPQEATVFALIYGIPLTQYVIFANSIANKSRGVWTTNSITHETTLANASYHTIVLPNVDTLYSESLIDLSTQDFVVTMPTMEAGRFYVWPFYDVYGNNFCNLGTATDSSAGSYLVTYRASQPGCDMTPSAEYAGIIYMPTPYGAALLRIQVNSPTDASYVVNSIQPKFTVAGVRNQSPQMAPRLTSSILNDGFSDGTNLPLYIMELTARLAPFNLPEVSRDIPFVTATLRLAGIGRGSYVAPPGVDLAAAFLSAKDTVHEVQTRDFDDLGNGWTILSAKLSGDFLSHYAVRAFVAFRGYMQLQPTQALYPVYEINKTLLASQTYRVQFFGKPAVDGFWSLTMYDEHGYLVPNKLNRFSLNNRDNMTYPNGDLVRDTAPDSKAQFYMLLQSTSYCIAPEWESNWLPSPANGAKFNFILCFYGPKKSLQEKDYEYPKVEAVEVNPSFPKN